MMLLEKIYCDLKNLKIHTDWILKENKRTIVKTRVIAQHQQLLRFDFEEKEKISKEIENKIVSTLKKNINSFDMVIISDYDKGFLTSNLIQNIIKISKKAKKKIIEGPKPSNVRYYKNASCLSLNRSEAIKSSGLFNFNQNESIERIGKFILSKLHLEALLITLSEKGMLLINQDYRVFIPACAREVYDVTGAGDTVLAVFSLALSASANYETAARIANKAAGIVVGKLGTATVTIDELKTNS